MKFEIRNQCLIITTDKEIDHHSSEIIREKADDYVMRNYIKNILFDFEKTEFMDSSGRGMIMGRYRLIKGIDGIVGIVNTNKNIDRIVLISGLHKVVHTYDSFENAIKNLGEES